MENADGNFTLNELKRGESLYVIEARFAFAFAFL